jgi:hypothetical protein
MSISILEIDCQKLSSVIVSYATCRVCGYATSDLNITLVGQPCSHCGSPSQGGMLLFKLGVYIMVDLMQEYYHLHPTESRISKALGENQENHLLAIIVFYCSLGEILLENFLTDYMNKISIPDKVQDELLKDISMDKRLGLFRALTGKKFSQAVEELDKDSNNDYQRVIKSYLDVREKRNKFLHVGNMFIIGKEMVEQCLIDSPILINLFVKLHNVFLVEHVNQTGNENA